MHNLLPMALTTSALPAAQIGTKSRLATAPAALVAPLPAATAPVDTPAQATAADDGMMTLAATCAFFGGDKPLNPSTLYRGIKAGRYPKPVHVGPNSSRWVRSECQSARQKLIAARDGARASEAAIAPAHPRCGAA